MTAARQPRRNRSQSATATQQATLAYAALSGEGIMLATRGTTEAKSEPSGAPWRAVGQTTWRRPSPRHRGTRPPGGPDGWKGVRASGGARSANEGLLPAEQPHTRGHGSWLRRPTRPVACRSRPRRCTQRLRVRRSGKRVAGATLGGSSRLEATASAVAFVASRLRLGVADVQRRPKLGVSPPLGRPCLAVGPLSAEGFVAGLWPWL